eukprot:TRINITY_DN12314_c1_g2_i1.p1 TRINITY_DN12314_c1_g2~~TRINITY_DN12314_c1_g2_i1.p1  ORF type:complete len:376 (+),score=74.25 TRINITY_DN12314_c1_g2_i1:56-1183(+)
MVAFPVSLATLLHVMAVAGSKMASEPSFKDYLLKHGKSYTHDYEARRLVFLQTHEKVIKQNQPGRLWTATLNKFSDWYDDELKTLRGYKRGTKKQTENWRSFSQAADFTLRQNVPETMDWRNLTSAKKIDDQGACGSCWAVASVSILNAHHEIHRGKPGDFSIQELVNCVPNPRECGGSGGCQGATVELAMGYVQANGLAPSSQVPYTAADGHCAKASSLVARSSGDALGGGSAFGFQGFQTLRSNAEMPLVRAVAEAGPVAISVAADAWSLYDHGIFDGDCGNVVDHAVSLFGYGKEGANKYWIVKNSWGHDWGEDGYIRILRHEDEETHCGLDSKPELGLACKGETDPITTCGTCGILYDSVVPHFTNIDADA